MLTPYDVLRLKRAAALPSTEFLEAYTLCPRRRPEISRAWFSRMNDGDKACPFLSDEGCGVYSDRPWACRMYPLGAAEPKNPTPTDQPFHFVIQE